MNFVSKLGEGYQFCFEIGGGQVLRTWTGFQKKCPNS
jgi:hypothetical protein